MKKYMKFSVTATLLALPLLVNAQHQSTYVDYDNLFIYSTSYGPSEYYSQGPVDKVLLSVVSDEIFIKKKTDSAQGTIENVVLSRIPSAQISWINDDVCTVIADKQAIEPNMGDFMADNDILSVRPAYIRKVYKDLMELYPVKQVALYGFTDEILVKQKNNNDDETAAYLASLNLQVEAEPGYWYKIYIPKDSDFISIANRLYESEYVTYQTPSHYISVRNTNTEPLEKTGLDYLYNSNGNKFYLYKCPGMFMVTKNRETDKTEIEAIIDKYLTAPSYKWSTNDNCQVEIEESLVDQTIASIRNEELVTSVNRSYLMLSDYESTLLNGTNNPSIFNYDQVIMLSFKDGTSKSVSDSLRNTFNLIVIDEPDDFFYTWSAPKTTEMFAVCNAIYESGYLEWIELNWSGFKVSFVSGSGTTDVKKPIASKIGESYYNILGRRMDSPSGLTIVVTHFSDGSISTEKKLFR